MMQSAAGPESSWYDVQRLLEQRVAEAALWSLFSVPTLLDDELSHLFLPEIATGR